MVVNYYAMVDIFKHKCYYKRMDTGPNGRRYKLSEDGEPLINLEAEYLRLTTEYGYPRRPELSGPVVEFIRSLGRLAIRILKRDNPLDNNTN